MKTNHWLFLTVTLFAGLFVCTAQADQRANTNLPPLLPPPGFRSTVVHVVELRSAIILFASASCAAVV